MSTLKKKNFVSSTTTFLLAISRLNTCPKKDIVESALQSDLRVVTSINMSFDKFICKYFFKCDYSKVLYIISFISWEEKNFTSYIKGIFTLNNQTEWNFWSAIQGQLWKYISSLQHIMAIQYLGRYLTFLVDPAMYIAYVWTRHQSCWAEKIHFRQ